MTFQKVHDIYNEDYKARSVDYGKIERLIMEAAKTQFPHLTEKQLAVISSENYDLHHSTFSDMIFGMMRLCEFATRLLQS